MDAASSPPAAPPRPPLFERLGVRFLHTLSASERAAADLDGIHVLNADERRNLRRVQRGTVVRATVAGALSALVTAAAELLALPLLEGDQVPLSRVVEHYAIVGGATAVASVLEIGFLYWDALRSVHRLAVVAGLDLTPGGAPAERAEVATALARAALELPNPTTRLFGVDPLRETSRARMVAISLLYKAKIAATGFLLKVLLRRIFGRALVRSWLPFVAVPVTAAWNGVVAHLVMREARVRAMGPSAAEEALRTVVDPALPLSPEGRVGVLRAIGAAIVRSEDLHPNLAALLAKAVARVGGAGDEPLDDTAAFLTSLEKLSASEQEIVLRVLTWAAVLDGRFTRHERRLLREAYAACGRPADLDTAERSLSDFVEGRPLRAQLGAPPERARAA